MGKHNSTVFLYNYCNLSTINIKIFGKVNILSQNFNLVRNPMKLQRIDNDVAK